MTDKKRVSLCELFSILFFLEKEAERTANIPAYNSGIDNLASKLNEARQKIVEMLNEK